MIGLPSSTCKISSNRKVLSFPLTKVRKLENDVALAGYLILQSSLFLIRFSVLN